MGHQVHFLLRSDYDTVQRQGVQIESAEGDFHVHPHCARRPEEIGPADAVLIGLKTTANGQFPELLPPLVGPATALVTLQNGLGNEEELARLFPAEQILGGLCFVCLNRVAPGVIRHLGYGLVVLGEYQRSPQPRTHELAARLREAGVPCTVTEDLARAHWEKLVWNIPFNGLGVAGAAGETASLRLDTATPLSPCLTTDELLADPRWAQLVRELMLEVIAGAHALGLEVEEVLADKLIARTRTMGAYKASTLLDFERGQPPELESLFLEPLRRATQAGAAMPRLSALCALLKELNLNRRTS
jgi:2-dehydropantoate 2-reductase